MGSQGAERRIHTQLLMIVVLVVGVRVLPLFAVLAMAYGQNNRPGRKGEACSLD